MRHYSTFFLIQAARQARIRAKEPTAQPAGTNIENVPPSASSLTTVYTVNTMASNPLRNSNQTDILMIVLKMAGIFFSCQVLMGVKAGKEQGEIIV